MSILGNRVLRKEDPKFLTTGGVYTDDLPLPGAVHVTYVRSTVAHARISSIDLDAARGAPGVVAVYTAEDFPELPATPPAIPMFNNAMVRSPLASDVVRYVGELVVAIVTEQRSQGPDAAELVDISYQPLPVVVDPEVAMNSTTLLHPDAGTNVCFDLSFGRTDDFFDGCDVVITQRIVNQRVAPCPLEVRAGAARWEPDGRLTQWVSTQAAHSVRTELAGRFGIDPDQIHVIAPDVGGGFGAKTGVYPEDLLLGFIAKRLGRPVKWTETRSDSMVGLGHGRGQVQVVELGGTRDGEIQAYRLTVIQDAGAYPSMGAMLPFMTRMMASGVYAIPKVEFNAKSVLTNTVPMTAYRGAGRPEAAAAIERVIDVYAAEIGRDPGEVRRRNLVAKEAFPFTTPTGTVYDCGDYVRALDLALEGAGYPSLRAEQQRRRDAGDTRQLGIGISIYVEITNPLPGGEYALVEVLPNGRGLVKVGTSAHGQGHATAFAMLASEQTGIPIDDIDVIHGDTDLVARGQGTMGSRSLQTGGVAVNQATAVVVDKARHQAAELLEANVDDVVLDRVGGRFHVTGTPSASRNWAEVAASLAGTGGLVAEVDFVPTGPSFPFGAHIAVVEVDTDTGKVTLERMVAVDDAGRILNPLLVEGQVHGGLAQGAAQALLEGFCYDADGNPTTGNLADYSFVSAAELPSFETIHMETPTPLNELGAKGIGESGTIGSTPAVQNAVVDALAHLGVRHVDMPTTPERVWDAISAARP